MPPLTEEQVVAVMEQELGVPWEDVFDTSIPQPLAAGTIAEVHRATLATGDPVVVKVQRPDAREQIEQDLALLEVFAEKVGERPGLKAGDRHGGRVRAPVGRRCTASSTSGEEAANMERMRGVIAPFSRLRGPGGDRRALHLPAARDAGRAGRAARRSRPRGRRARRPRVSSSSRFYKQIMVDGFFHADPHPGQPDVAARPRTRSTSWTWAWWARSVPRCAST